MNTANILMPFGNTELLHFKKAVIFAPKKPYYTVKEMQHFLGIVLT
jgi:hypothetical protein